MFNKNYQEDSENLKFSIFNYDQKMFSRYVKKTIEHCINSNGTLIDIPKMVSYLGFKVYHKEMHDKAYIDYSGERNYAKLYLNDKLSFPDQQAIAILIISEFFVRFRQNQKKKIVFDMIYLSNINRIKMSKQVFLATRLALPEKIIEKMDNFNSDKQRYSELSRLPVYFLDLARKKKSVEMYLKMTDSDFTCWINELK